MIRTVLRISWLVLSRDRWALLLSFVVPIAFFSILALVFGGGIGRDALPAVRVAVFDDDRTPASARVLRALAREPGLAVEPRTTDAGAAQVAAAGLVRRGEAPVAVVVPAGFGERMARFPAATLTLELFGDGVADPVARNVVGGLLQRAVVLASPDDLVRALARWVEEESGPLAPAQRELVDEIAASFSASDGPNAAPAPSPLEVVVTDVATDGAGGRRSAVSYYAAAIGVMFLLFTMSSAMRGLVEEAESGTLERLLGTDLTMVRLLFARWAFATILGCVQLAVMFLWGWAVFGLDLFGPGHLVGTVVMTIASAAAAASFGLVLGTLCRSTAQMQGLSTVVILLMSALGGSMMPRYLMPEAMQRAGLVTFNAWAVAGYEKVLWRDAPVTALWPELSVLVAVTLVGAIVARTLARRWESV
jgi:ABC-2 type transport system permease protein